MGKLDAICAKLKQVNHTDQDGTDPVRENNNNEKLISNGFELTISTCSKHDHFNTVTLSSRRKKRKAATPRNLTQVLEYLEQFDDKDDELAEYEINNHNTFFAAEDTVSREPSDCDEFGFDDNIPDTPFDWLCDDSAILSENFDSQQSSPKLRNNEKAVSEEESLPLDLSVVHVPENLYCVNEETSEYHFPASPEASDIANIVHLMSAVSHGLSEPATLEPRELGETKVLMDYAESTMNELLRMYGFEGKAETLTKQVPLKNFSTKQILQTKLQNNLKWRPLQSKVIATINGSGLKTPAKGIFTNLINIVNTPVSEVKKDVSNSPHSPAAFKDIYCIPQSKGANPLPTPKKSPLPDYTKYLKKYHNGEDCDGAHCKELSYKEHYHCMDCSFLVFVKKEEMVRHLKWHKKREESLQHGFLRYSPMDDCSQKFGKGCTHYGKQTHYHCLQSGCDKVYISTSDVQMHANYHRKDSAIIQEGFQRFRATEDCGTQYCAFYRQRTTHFHCRRIGCKFTFKNKADMEKHKGYHQKDEMLAKDGFKKFMKYEDCCYQTCRFSKVNNHIHCIRPGCNYVLHSTAQLYSHKRKHEKREIERYYRKVQEERMKRHVNLNLDSLSRVTSFSDQEISSLLPASSAQLVTASMFMKQESPDLSILGEASEAEDISLNMSAMSCGDEASFDSKNISSDLSIQENEKPSVLGPQPCYIASSKLTDSLSLPIPMYRNRDVFEEPDDADTDSPVSPSLSPSCLSESSVTVSTAGAPTTDGHSIPVPATIGTPCPDRKDKDETWKKYLERFTANDHCNSRCCYLYKDHYHCRLEGCSTLFRSKDGIREHARLHDLQACLTPVAYKTYLTDDPCPNSCQYSQNKKHFHCNWAGCTHVIPIEGPTFGRLEHYRVHDYARLPAGRMYKPVALKMEDDKRRRGRPPKFPRTDIPRVPKVELSELEIIESTKIMNEDQMDEKSKIINGFQMFDSNERCPDDLCLYSTSKHFHCARPRCHHSTDRLDVLNLHAKDFHSFINILEGFEFFDCNINCRRANCQNNKLNKHYHCIRSWCDYSFVRQRTMFQHDKKHKTDVGSPLSPAMKREQLELTECSLKTFVPIVPALQPLSVSLVDVANKVVVKTSGTYFPLSGLQTVSVPGVIASTVTSPDSENVSQPIISSIPLVSVSGTGAIPTVTSAIPIGAQGVPLTVLLQQKGSNALPQASWSLMRANMHFNIQQICGRPFCKLKRKDHYHCFECNQAFSAPARLRCHVAKHGFRFKRCESNMRVVRQTVPVNIAPKPPKMLPLGSPIPSTELEDCDHSPDIKCTSEINPSSSLTLNPSTFSNMIAKAQGGHQYQADEEPSVDNDENDTPMEMTNEPTIRQMEVGDGVLGERENSINYENSETDSSILSPALKNSDKSRRSGRKRVATRHNDFVDSDPVVVKHRTLSASPRANLDELIPNGYVRCSFKKDCGYPNCTYRCGLTHFHCARSDCGYSFSDRSRLVQHTLRHERIDSITGGELQQFRINQDCCETDCEFNKKASHFHCFKCPYSCTDSSKVLTHRKFHAKMNSINSQGFQKFAIFQDCQTAGCNYSKKQTHYHCLSPGCNHTVLGPAQMAPHKLKHEGNFT